MLRDITLGQYYITDSKLHRLDPRVKLAGTMIYIITLFLVKGMLGYLIAAIFFAVMVKVSRVPFRFMVRGLKAIVSVLIITGVCNLLFFNGEQKILEYGIITITLEGIENAICMTIRLIMLILGTSIMTLTTTPNDLTDGIEKSAGFLERFRIPVHEIALMMSIALRFIPILVEETNKIMKAQISRGADFESGGLIKRVKNYVPIIVPLFISAFHRASDLAMAMESRCYRTGK
ncbi:MAG: energy-coupling factor transporter transmembrane protein EcfT [Lachnospiraceae bacterium]|nr:energy-coupling factor transporter transmembrane protein EcfT [Lachnospiraceae bacterium]